MDEFCFEEVIARHRGWVAGDWSANKESKSEPASKSAPNIKSISQERDGGRIPVVTDVTQEPSKDETTGRFKRKKTMEVKGETQTGMFNPVIADYKLTIV